MQKIGTLYTALVYAYHNIRHKEKCSAGNDAQPEVEIICPERSHSLESRRGKGENEYRCIGKKKPFFAGELKL